jgi:hypothetical protein
MNERGDAGLPRRGARAASGAGEAVVVSSRLRLRFLQLWRRRLGELPTVNAMALPAAMAYLMPETIAKFSARLVSANAGLVNCGEPPDWPPGCLCGQNPFWAYYVSGAWALEQAVFDVGGTTAWWSRRRWILCEWRAMAEEEVSGFCALCRLALAQGGKACPNGVRRPDGRACFSARRVDLDQGFGAGDFSAATNGDGMKEPDTRRPSALRLKQTINANEHTQLGNHRR